MTSTSAWRADAGSTALERIEIERRELRADDVRVRIDYCGVCHSDLHAIHSGRSIVPGHEFTGTVIAVGTEVTAFAPGDAVAVGTIVDSCGACDMCATGHENYCRTGATLTYNSRDRVDGSTTLGGYSREYIVRDRFVFALPEGTEAAASAPLLCAGITVWEPLRAAGVGPGTRVAVAGLGGLGHLAVKIAVALGAEVTVLSRSADKRDDARDLGATGFLVTTDETATAAARGSVDVLLDTVSAPHPLPPYLDLLGLDGTLYLLGSLGPVPLTGMDLLPGRKRISSAGTGGTAGTRELLAFAAEHGITADVEVLPSGRVAEALDRLERGDVRYRFVLDMADLDPMRSTSAESGPAS